jgi:acetamidase/formamidase
LRKRLSQSSCSRHPAPANRVGGIANNEVAKKATRYMVEHISKTYDISLEEAYMLCSLIRDLKIAEVVDLPHILVTMHIPKSVFEKNKKTNANKTYKQ